MEQAAKPTEAPKQKIQTKVLAIIIVAILVVVGVGVYLLLPRTSPVTIGERLTIWDTNGVCAQSANPPNCGFKDSSGSSNVTITVGTTVEWTNSGGTTHTVYTCDTTNYNNYHSAGACPHGANSQTVESFTSPDITKNGGTYDHTFNTKGTYYYFCSIHPFMNAEMIVQ
ncbi:MAG TPA: plastocyanin/azurin family copper-binding protein [Candidatus Bathyarchaeia archaeon]